MSSTPEKMDRIRKYIPTLMLLAGLVFMSWIITIAPKGVPRVTGQENCEVGDE
tara:strand:- start:313 stop:471 length:159 start_codon:yes stop_codon:yes gene_type:complete